MAAILITGASRGIGFATHSSSAAPVIPSMPRCVSPIDLRLLVSTRGHEFNANSSRNCEFL